MINITIVANSYWNLYNFRFSLIKHLSNKYNITLIAPKDKYFNKTLSNMQEVIARGGKIFFITDNKKSLISENIRSGIRVPFLGDLLSPIMLTIPLQLLAYHVALLKNCDIDKPRNLAKSVTVE